MSGGVIGQSRRGFIAPLTLVTIAVIAIALWSAMAVLTGIARDLGHLADEVRLETAGLTMEARLAYWITTEPADHLGVRINGRRITATDQIGAPAASESALAALGGTFVAPPRPLRGPAERPFVFDSRLYRDAAPGVGPVSVSIQDGGGLFNLLVFDTLQLTRLLVRFGVEEPQARRLAATAVDYVDEDDLIEANGAEADDYARAGLAPPLNRPLRSPEEIFGALGWAQAFAPATRARFQTWLTVSGQASLRNLSTAPPEVLSAWYGLTPAQAAQVVAARSPDIRLTTTDLNRITGALVPVDVFEINLISARDLRMTVFLQDGRQRSLRREIWLSRADPAQDRPYFRRGARFVSAVAEFERGDPNSGFGTVEAFPSIGGRVSR